MSVGWSGSIQEFLHIEQHQFLNALQDSILDASSSQIRAWIDSYQKIKEALCETPDIHAEIIFEYQLLRGGGRRPDILLLVNDQLLVIECKSFNEVTSSEYMQASMYVRDLEHYHSAIQEKNIQVVGILLLTNALEARVLHKSDYNLLISSIDGLKRILKKAYDRNDEQLLSAQEFLQGLYQPTPSVIEAARAIIKNESLPRIRLLDSSNFEYVFQSIHTIIEQAKSNHEHHLVFITGEPGAGKTYLGLKLVHDHDDSIYLSGNRPLVEVLQHTLNNKTFVQSLYNYKTDYLNNRSALKEHIIIFDEAQRAWDKERVNATYRSRETPAQVPNLSEPDIIMNIATKNKKWSVTVGLVGEGQEIYTGEERGLPLWNEALVNKQIIVHGKQEKQVFPHATQFYSSNKFHLNTSLRSHAALNYSDFVKSFIEGDFKTAAEIVPQLDTSRFHLRITQDLEKAKQTANQLYPEDEKTIGVVCAKGLNKQKRVKVLYDDGKNRPSKIVQFFNIPTSPYYCRTLNYSITEFQSQGLEFDFSILQWDNDFYLKNGIWIGQHFQADVSDPLQIKRNAYRVNLTRGRDGLIIYVPKMPDLEETWHTFKHTLGIQELI